MLEPSGELDLAAETILVDAGRHLRRQDFNDYFTPKFDVHGEEDARHSTPTEFALDAVGLAQGGLKSFRQLGQLGVPVQD
jgi:hypothetical protein